jgi:dolichyl-diphosphooligosaccharide--protein glycosyltransferase
LAKEEKRFARNIPPQYLVLSWENMRLAYWISYFGTWDLVRGGANAGKIQRVRGQVQFDMKQGTIQAGGRQIPLDGLILVRRKTSRKMTWPNGSNIYGVLNELSQEMYLMDGTIYHSMMVQMLLGKPERFEEHFELVVDRYPWNRAYRVR